MTNFGMILYFLALFAICYLIHIATSSREGQKSEPYSADDQIVRSLVVQFIESVEVMSSSKIIETIVGRADFLEGVLGSLRAYQKQGKRRYLMQVQRGMDDYRFSYYDRQIPGWIFRALKDPDGFGYHSFYARALYAGFIRSYRHQILHLQTLKRDAAIKRRCGHLQYTYKEFMRYFNRDWRDNGANDFKSKCLPELRHIERVIVNAIKSL